MPSVWFARACVRTRSGCRRSAAGAEGRLYALGRDGYTVDGEGSCFDQGIGALAIVAENIKDLKELGLYGEATIVMATDRVEWYLADEITGPTAPMLMVKPSTEAGGSIGACCRRLLRARCGFRARGRDPTRSLGVAVSRYTIAPQCLGGEHTGVVDGCADCAVFFIERLRLFEIGENNTESEHFLYFRIIFPRSRGIIDRHCVTREGIVLLT